jgi:hypothetical protein
MASPQLVRVATISAVPIFFALKFQRTVPQPMPGKQLFGARGIDEAVGDEVDDEVGESVESGAGITAA